MIKFDGPLIILGLLCISALENKIEEVKRELQEVKKALSQFKDEILEAVSDRNCEDDPRENLNQLFPTILTSEEEVERFERKLSEKPYKKSLVSIFFFYTGRPTHLLIRCSTF